MAVRKLLRKLVQMVKPGTPQSDVSNYNVVDESSITLPRLIDISEAPTHATIEDSSGKSRSRLRRFMGRRQKAKLAMHDKTSCLPSELTTAIQSALFTPPPLHDVEGISPQIPPRSSSLGCSYQLPGGIPCTKINEDGINEHENSKALSITKVMVVKLPRRVVLDRRQIHQIASELFEQSSSVLKAIPSTLSLAQPARSMAVTASGSFVPDMKIHRQPINIWILPRALNPSPFGNAFVRSIHVHPAEHDFVPTVAPQSQQVPAPAPPPPPTSALPRKSIKNHILRPQQLLQSLASAKKDIEVLQNANQSLREQRNLVRNILQQAVGGAVELVEALNTLIRINQDWQIHSAALEAQLGKARAANDAWQVYAHDREMRLMQLQTEYDELQAQSNRRDEDYNRLVYQCSGPPHGGRSEEDIDVGESQENDETALDEDDLNNHYSVEDMQNGSGAQHSSDEDTASNTCSETDSEIDSGFDTETTSRLEHADPQQTEDQTHFRTSHFEDHLASTATSPSESSEVKRETSVHESTKSPQTNGHTHNEPPTQTTPSVSLSPDPDNQHPKASPSPIHTENRNLEQRVRELQRLCHFDHRTSQKYKKKYQITLQTLAATTKKAAGLKAERDAARAWNAQLEDRLRVAQEKFLALPSERDGEDLSVLERHLVAALGMAREELDVLRARGSEKGV